MGSGKRLILFCKSGWQNQRIHIISEVCRLLKGAVQDITGDWQESVHHTVSEINSAFANKELAEDVVHGLIICIQSRSSSADDESHTCGSEDDDESEMEMEMLFFPRGKV